MEICSTFALEEEDKSNAAERLPTAFSTVKHNANRLR